jgi:hypothetical protein
MAAQLAKNGALFGKVDPSRIAPQHRPKRDWSRLEQFRPGGGVGLPKRRKWALDYNGKGVDSHLGIEPQPNCHRMVRVPEWIG